MEIFRDDDDDDDSDDDDDDDGNYDDDNDYDDADDESSSWSVAAHRATQTGSTQPFLPGEHCSSLIQTFIFCGLFLGQFQLILFCKVSTAPVRFFKGNF